MNLEIANRLQKLRKEKGYSQEQLAEALGISRQAVSKWERAESSPDTDNLICLAKLYGISLDELLSTDESVEEIVQNNEPEEILEYKRSRVDLHGISTISIVIIYLILGSVFGWWHPGWIIFLFIPINSSIIETVRTKNPHNFAYPVFAAAVYLFLGSVFGWWHPGWIIFITIPVYYMICDCFKKDEDEDPEDEDEEE